ncbi:hypothetical protein [Ruminiclostridium josui]|uniref:hypothetical protein n=1 Tax=Ruminiclostridium josui TaxID=1499 RepID=UPI00046473A9|nr:hypothetical protein [Ruminiclostridium josui]
MLVLFVLEMTVIIMLINSIRLVGACNVLWFNLKYKDFFLSIIYLITIIINETIYIKGLPKDHRSLQYILSSIMAVIIFYCSLSVKSAIVVYWVVSGVFNICFNQYMEKYISKKHIDFDNKVFSEIFMSIKNNNMKGC